DQGVIDQAKALWQAMDDLGRIQRFTHQQLYDDLKDQVLAQQIWRASKTTGPIVYSDTKGPENIGLREVFGLSNPVKATQEGFGAAPMHAPPGTTSASIPAPNSHMRAMAM